MINAEQIRAARALLDWSTADLAKLTGLTTNGINKIERGHVAAHDTTLERLQTIFEESGLEFLPFSGVKKKESLVIIWEGRDAVSRLFDDVYATLRDVGGEVLISGLDETRFVEVVGRAKLESHVDRLAACKVFGRLLIQEGDTHLIGPRETYHWVPKKYFAQNPFYIYGSKLALVIWENPQKVILIDDASMTESVRKLFNFVWDNTKPPAKNQKN